MSAVQGKHVGPSIRLFEVAQPGAFQFVDHNQMPIDDAGTIEDGKDVWFLFCCPQSGAICAPILTLRNTDQYHTWNWTGPAVAPTLSPDIECNCGCGWHGQVTKGEFTK